MEKEELRRASTIVYYVWPDGKVQESLEAALRIRSHQGFHEAEVSCGGEGDLHRHYRSCQKNPGHTQFIPIKDLKIEHLPPDYRDNDVLKYIRTEADLTCRLLVKCTSMNRPKYHPVRTHLLYPFSKDRGGDFMRTGTGWVEGVEKFTEKDNKDCECQECTRPGTETPKKEWGNVFIWTAMHVVFDNEEARRTTCHFGYDTSTTRLDRCLKFTGLKFQDASIGGDWCRMMYVTHDMDIINKLYDMFVRRQILSQHVRFNASRSAKSSSPSVSNLSCAINPKPGHIVIISHPHGCSKQISVGMWTDRKTWSKPYSRKTEVEVTMVDTSYTYNTPTCPGSSGAPVIRLLGKEKFWWMSRHFHSEGGEGNTNNNKCAVLEEYLAPPPGR